MYVLAEMTNVPIPLCVCVLVYLLDYRSLEVKRGKIK